LAQFIRASLDFQKIRESEPHRSGPRL
jgi:hypothetical protein